MATVKSLSVESREEGWSSFLNKDIRLFGNGFSDKNKERFYSEMGILFAAGVDIRSALELIEQEQGKEKDKLLFEKIKNSIVAGSGLAAALDQAGVFSPYEIHSIRIGEESGRLKEVLKELAFYYAKKISQKRQVTSALSYPAVVFLAAFGAIFFMMRFVVPMFSDVFKRFKGELPAFTRLIIQTSDFFKSYGLWMILGLFGLATYLYWQRNANWFRKYGAKLVLRTPILGDLVAKIYLARFCQSMHLLISAKTPLVTSLELVEKMVGFYPLEISLEPIRKDIMNGVSLHKSLSKFKIYSKRMISLLMVAEEVNQLDAMFGTLAKQYSDEVEHQTGLLGSLIEPVMILFLGALVAVILVAMYLPMFQMSSTVG